MTTNARLALFAPPGLGLVLVLVVAAAAASRPQPPKNDDDEDRELDRRTVQRVVRENCTICHDDGLIASQRLTSKQWKAEVEKMVGWGSPLPAEHVQGVIDYLSAEFPDGAPAAPLPRLKLPEAEATELAGAPDDLDGSTDRGAPVYAANCANCHGPDGQGAELGPNLVEKPVLYRAADYHDRVRKGRGRMPAFEGVVDAGAGRDVLAWLRSRRYTPPEPAR